MKKRNFGVLALSSVLAFGTVGVTLSSLTSCGQKASFSTLTAEIGEQTYGTTVDLRSFVRFDGKEDATKVVTVSVVSTKTLKTVKDTTVKVVGVGECEVTLSCEGVSTNVKFEAVPVVSGIQLKNVGFVKVGQSINLDDYVSVVVSAPITATAEYVATVKSTSVCSLAEDGKTLTFNALGKYEVEISAKGASSTKSLTGKVVSETEASVRNFLGNVTDNYGIQLMDGKGAAIGYRVIHNKNYNVQYLGAELTGKDSVASGSIRFPGSDTYDNGYFFEGTLDTNGNVDTSSIVCDAPNAYLWEQYFVNMEFNSSVIDAFSYQKDENEEYLVAECTPDVQNDSVYSTLVYRTSFQDFSDAYTKLQIRLFTDTLGGDEVVRCEVYGLTSQGQTEYASEFAFTTVGTAQDPNLEAYIADLNNMPQPADVTNEVNFLLEGKKAKNYTTTYQFGFLNSTTGGYATSEEINSVLTGWGDLACVEGTTKFVGETFVDESVSYADYENDKAQTKSLFTGFKVSETDNCVHELTRDESNQLVESKDPITGQDGSKFSTIYDILYSLDLVTDKYGSGMKNPFRDEATNVISYTVNTTSQDGVLGTAGLLGTLGYNASRLYLNLEFNSGETCLGLSSYKMLLAQDGSSLTFTVQSPSINFGNNVGYVLIGRATISAVGTTVIE